MMHLIIKETQYENMDNSYRVMDFANDIDTATDMLQGYQLIEKDERNIYSIVKYETPLILKREVA